MPVHPKIRTLESNKKTCNKCLEVQSIEFYVGSPPHTGKDGRFNICRTCWNKRTIKWRKKNPEKTKQYARNHDLKIRYPNAKYTVLGPDGVILEQWERGIGGDKAYPTIDRPTDWRLIITKLE